MEFEAHKARAVAAAAICLLAGVFGGLKGGSNLWKRSAETPVYEPVADDVARGPTKLPPLYGLSARLFALRPEADRRSLLVLGPKRGPLFETLEATDRRAAFLVASTQEGAVDAQLLMTRLFPRRCVVVPKHAETWAAFVASIDDPAVVRAAAGVGADVPLFVVDFGAPLGAFAPAVAERVYGNAFVGLWSVR